MLQLTAPRDTLAYHMSRPLVTRVDISKAPSSVVATTMRRFKNQDMNPDTSPESSARLFYMLNNAMAEARQRHGLMQPLGPWAEFAEMYSKKCSDLAERSFYYLLLICTREARHVAKQDGFMSELTKKFGSAVAEYTTNLPDAPDKAQSIFMSKPPQYTLGEHCRALQFIFYEGKFNSGYGGPKWGAIADCTSRFVHGEYSAEMMLDTVWTLAHNGGPIFNKGMFFGSYGEALLRILDAQRGGQIPQAIGHDNTIRWCAGKELQALVAKLYKLVPELDKPVDWHVVEALGAKKKYTMSEKPPKETAEKVAEVVAKKAKSWSGVGSWYVMPGLSVTPAKTQRKAA